MKTWLGNCFPQEIAMRKKFVNQAKSYNQHNEMFQAYMQKLDP